MREDRRNPEIATIAYVPLPRFTWRMPLKRFILIIIASGVILSAWAAIDPAQRDMILFISIAMLVALPIGWVIASIHRSGIDDHIDARHTNAITESVLTLEHQLGVTYWSKEHWSLLELQEQLRPTGVDLPRTIVDERLKPRLEEIGLPPEMLEPEPILQSGTSGRAPAIFGGVFYLLFTLLQLTAGHYLFAAAFAVMGAALLASYPPVRDLFRNARWDEGNIVAGLGWLKYKESGQWTVNDAVLLVQTAAGRPPMYLSFVGESGYLLLTFTDERDPDFVKLWQRWNHPQPRPELRME